MKKCLHCNEECDDSLSICPKCGALIDEYVDTKEYMDVYHINHGKKIRNKKLILWFLLGLILPYISFLIFWIMYDGDREKARAILIGAIISTVFTTLLGYLIPVLFGEDSGNGDMESNGEKVKMLFELYKNI